MMTRHDRRRFAMQLLYQLDLYGEQDLRRIDADFDAEETEAPIEPEQAEAAESLARAAWEQREAADALSTELATQWPSHRQPPVDRAILRLGYHELTTGTAPAAVVINEAVELAKTYGDEPSPAFVNGVLDAMVRRLKETGDLAASEQEADSA